MITKDPLKLIEWASAKQDGHEMVDSCLIEGRKGMDRAVLEVVASKAVATKHDVKRYVQCTLLAATKDFQVRRLPKVLPLQIPHQALFPRPVLTPKGSFPDAAQHLRYGDSINSRSVWEI